ncbi:glycosyltransferase family 4 protein [Edwardsiella tarda]|uniref:glycosyltransferase family 4 protein n=1 Tax=Edwardsiella tarda TaxID=636 RepID=UPI00099004EC|nr:glycosyltransferase family 4 protein [Edwardsiella tarda]
MYKIVISANSSWYLYNFRKNTIISLLHQGYSVTVVAPRDSYSDDLEKLGVSFIDVYIDKGGSNPINDIKTFLHFKSIYANTKYDMVLNFTPKNNIYSTLAAKMSGMKIINNVAGLGVLFINEGITTKVARMLYKFSQRYASKIFFQNEDDRILFLKNNMVKDDVTDRLPGSGVDLNRFSVMRAEDDNVIRFLLIARMLYDKGVGHYVEAARVLRPKYGTKVEFSLLGFLDVNNPSAVSKEQMQLWVGEGIVNYLGVSDSVEKEIAKVDCIVLPSFYREGVPKSLLEAGAMGKPIVTTDNVGCRETVEHGVNGFLCEPRSTESLIVMLDKMIQLSHQERLNMGYESRKKIEREFDEQIVINKYLDTIKSVL